MRLPKRGAYSGRLAFDPDTLYHTDEKGRRVVTEDGGLTWRYAVRKDTSHNARYERRALMVETTANVPDPEPHHYVVQDSDAHYAGVLSDPDVEAATVTSHTDAWKDQA